MSITIVTDLFCDICADWTSGTTCVKPRAMEVRRFAREHLGWVRKFNPEDGEMQDICPDCNSEKS